MRHTIIRNHADGTRTVTIYNEDNTVIYEACGFISSSTALYHAIRFNAAGDITEMEV